VVRQKRPRLARRLRKPFSNERERAGSGVLQALPKYALEVIQDDGSGHRLYANYGRYAMACLLILSPFTFHFSPFTASLPFPLAVDIDGVPLSL
jgi:hypothetical protein